MAEQERKLVVDAAVTVGQVGVADPARDDVDDDLARSRIGDDHIHHLDRLTLLPRNHTAHRLSHAYNLTGGGVATTGNPRLQMSRKSRLG